MITYQPPTQWVLVHPTNENTYLGACGAHVGPNDALRYCNHSFAQIAAVQQLANAAEGPVRWTVSEWGLRNDLMLCFYAYEVA